MLKLTVVKHASEGKHIFLKLPRPTVWDCSLTFKGRNNTWTFSCLFLIDNSLSRQTIPLPSSLSTTHHLLWYKNLTLPNKKVSNWINSLGEEIYESFPKKSITTLLEGEMLSGINKIVLTDLLYIVNSWIYCKVVVFMDKCGRLLNLKYI